MKTWCFMLKITFKLLCSPTRKSNIIFLKNISWPLNWKSLHHFLINLIYFALALIWSIWISKVPFWISLIPVWLPMFWDVGDLAFKLLVYDDGGGSNDDGDWVSVTEFSLCVASWAQSVMLAECKSCRRSLA